MSALQNLLDQFPRRYRAGGQKQLRAVLAAIAEGDEFVEQLVGQVRDNLLSPTASGAWLDRRASLYGVTRGNGSGILDEDFRLFIPLLGMTPKQITQTVNALLDVAYGPYSTHAHVQSAVAEPFVLVNGDLLRLSVDGREVSLAFETGDFVNISAATAAEVAAAVTRKTGGRVLGLTLPDVRTGQVYVTIRSATVGPQGFLKVLGGNAQNRLRFPSVRPTALSAATWSVSRVRADLMRYSLASGVWPGLQGAGVAAGDFVSIRTDSGLLPANTGSFEVVSYDSSSFVVRNAEGLPQAATTLLHDDDILFFRPYKANLLTSPRPAAAFETTAGKLTVVMPVTSPVVKRTLRGGHHLHGGLATATAATSNSITLTNPAGFRPAGGTLRAAAARGRSEGAVDSVGLSQVTLADGTNWPSSGSFWSSSLRTMFQYASRSGDTLGGVVPAPPAGLAGQIISYSPVWTYASLSGSTLVGVYPDPSPLLGLELAGGSYSIEGYPGSYAYDTGRTPGSESPWPAIASPPPVYVASATNTRTAVDIAQGSNRTLVQVQSVAGLPKTGSVIIDFGGDSEEGPIKFFGLSGTTGVILDPSHVFRHSHSAGTELRLVTRIGEYAPRINGQDYAVYATSTAPARQTLQSFIHSVTAAGVGMVYDISLPSYKWPLPVSLYSVNPNLMAL